MKKPFELYDSFGYPEEFITKTCSICGEYVFDDNYEYLNGEFYCHSCMQENGILRCDGCGGIIKSFEDDYNESNDGFNYCLDCYDLL